MSLRASQRIRKSSQELVDTRANLGYCFYMDNNTNTTPALVAALLTDAHRIAARLNRPSSFTVRSYDGTHDVDYTVAPDGSYATVKATR